MTWLLTVHGGELVNADIFAFVYVRDGKVFGSVKKSERGRDESFEEIELSGPWPDVHQALLHP